MVGVLIEMRGAILRRGVSGSRGRLIGGLLLALFVTLLAVGTLLAWRTITTRARAPPWSRRSASAGCSAG